MNNPDQAINVVLNEVNFWAQYQDDTYGGFVNEVANDGSYSQTSQKSFCSNSRLAYAFVRAFMVTGNFEYLEKARHALTFIYDHGWDNTYGGWYYAANYDGTNQQENTYHSGKWSYTQHYCMLGNVAMNEATGGTIPWNDGDESDETWMHRGLDVIYNNLWDNSTGIAGFYEIANQDWSNPHNKGFTPTADGLTTHATVMSLRDIDDYYKTSFFTLVDRIAYDIVPSSYTSGSPLIYEYANSNWEPFGDELFNGHAVKCAWNLARAYLIDPTKTIYKQKAQQILDELLARGYYDNTNGGIHYFQTSGQKSHWTQEQGILAGMLVAQITDDAVKKQQYLNLADGCWKFMEEHMIDFNGGGSYTDVQTDGTVSSQWGKGDYWEAGYHTTETAYYTYLYNTIYMKNRPVELYYYFAPLGTIQTHKLTPLSIESNSLIIEEVTLNGTAYTNFNSDTRVLTVPANQGGTFKVKFRYNPDIFVCPTVSLGSDVSICEISPFTIDSDIIADGNLDFTWYKDGSIVKGPDFESNTLTVTEGGTYALEISGDNCYSIDEIEISNSVPAFSLGNDFSYTEPTELTTGLSNSFSHTWFLNGNGISGETTNTITITQAGIYSVEVTSQACGSASDEIIVSSAPTIAYTSDNIIIDGTKDNAFGTSLTANNFVLGTTNENDLSAEWSSLWDDTYLYIYASVTDDNLSNDSGNWWEDDGIELYIDGDNSRNTSYDNTNDFQWGFNWNSNTIYTGGSNPTNSSAGINFSLVGNNTGYTLEAAIPWTTIGVSPTDGNVIGIEIGINDDDNGSGRDSKLMWHTAVDDSWQNPSLFAEIELSGNERNRIPVANAGTDKTVVQPASTTTLSGSATGGDGTLSYLWTTNSSATITNATSLTPTISGLINTETYTFTLTITDEDGDTDSDDVTITVNNASIPVTGVMLNYTTIELLVGESLDLDYDISPSNATNTNVTWQSSSSSVSVNQNGSIVANSIGSAIVSVITEDGGYTDDVQINVSDGQSDCIEIAIPNASNWDILNDWNDGNSGSTIVTENGSMNFTHRAWGNSKTYLVHVGYPISVQAGTSYSISFDINDEDLRLSDISVGLCTSVAWNAPSNIISTTATATAPYGNGSFTTKTVTITPTSSSINAMLFFYLTMNTQISEQNYLFKNIEICNNSMKNYSNIESSKDISDSDCSIKVYPNPAYNYITTFISNEEIKQMDYSIISADGTVITKEKRKGNLQTFSLEQIPSGVYMLKTGNKYVYFTVNK